MKIDQIYYTPQQLASFFSIKKDTLLYYDRIGLFSPDVRNKNGYRYYTAAKLNELDSILTMRDLGLSINAIKEVVGRLDTPSFLELLSKEEESIQEKMSECRKTLSIVRKIKNNINEARLREKGRMYIEKVEELPIVKRSVKVKDGNIPSDDDWQDAYSALMATSDCKSIISVGSVLRLDEAEKLLGAVFREVYVQVHQKSDEHIPKGEYASMYFQGSLDNLTSFYKAFFEDIHDKGLKPLGDVYEELSISPIITKDESEHVTKLMVMVYHD